MAQRDVIAIGASAGGVEALQSLVKALPGDLPAAVLIVLHVPSTGTSALPRILDRNGALPCEHAKDGESLRHGRIYVAPPDRHLLLNDDQIVLTRGPRENGYRPAIDVLFRSAARELASRVMGVVLSGALDDGSAGLRTIADRGGAVLIQDPSDALYPGMPSNALAVNPADFTGSAAQIGQELVRMAGTAAPTPPAPAGRDLIMEAAMAKLDQQALDDPERPGVPSGFACPDCQGGLFELPADQLRYRCRVGHAWTAVSLLAQRDAGLEHALWMALRSLEEKAALARRMAATARARGNTRTAAHYDEAESEALAATGKLRDLLLSHPAEVAPATPEPVDTGIDAPEVDVLVDNEA